MEYKCINLKKSKDESKIDKVQMIHENFTLNCLLTEVCMCFRFP